MTIIGSWKLKAWRRLVEGEPPFYPLGEDVVGRLIYAEDGTMAVQMAGANRPTIPTQDALGGTPDQRAAAYSTCLAYFGTYEVQGESVIHRVEASLFPNWSGTVQARPYTLEGEELVLRTPPSTGAGKSVVNEMSWTRGAPCTPGRAPSDRPCDSGPGDPPGPDDRSKPAPPPDNAATAGGPMSMRERIENFLRLSCSLTGFARVELMGTGMVDAYFRAMEESLPAGVLDELLAACGRPSECEDLAASVVTTIIDDPKLGPVAQNLILLWYCGSWTALPADWRAAHGAAPQDRTRVVSAEAYQAGLQWVVAGAHPPGAQAQGFGAWSQAPREGVR